MYGKYANNQIQRHIQTNSVLNESELKGLLGDDMCLLSITTSGEVLSTSHPIWHGCSISDLITHKTSIIHWMPHNKPGKDQLLQKWNNWLVAGGQKIRLWYQDPSKANHRMPIEVRTVAHSSMKHNGNTLYLIIKDLTNEWTQREMWRNKLRKAKKERSDSYQDLATWLHDWKTPLQTIESSAWLCHRYELDKDHKKRTQHLSRIEKAVHEMKIGMQDWQTWHEPPTPRSVQRIDLFDLIQERIDQLKPILKPGQVIHFWHQGNQTIHTDRTALVHILDNLLSNASKYSPDQSSIWVRIWNRKDILQIDIQDQGIGIPKNELAHLFEARYRATNALDCPGNGLGLSTVHRLVNQLGGTIQVTSELNRGTTFSINLKNQQQTYEKNSDHRRQPRDPIKHRGDTGISSVSNPNR